MVAYVTSSQNSLCCELLTKILGEQLSFGQLCLPLPPREPSAVHIESGSDMTALSKCLVTMPEKANPLAAQISLSKRRLKYPSRGANVTTGSSKQRAVLPQKGHGHLKDFGHWHTRQKMTEEDDITRLFALTSQIPAQPLAGPVGEEHISPPT